MLIKENKEVAKNIFRLVLKGKSATQKIEPGQFLYLKITDLLDPLLRRPISISDVLPEEELIVLYYRVQGNGTKKLAMKRTGEYLNVVGPLGNGYPYQNINKKSILLIGGGIGIPPLYYLAKKLKELNILFSTYLGFNNREEFFLIKEFRELAELKIATIDGSFGAKGFVTDILPDDKDGIFYACGPTPMLKELQNKYSTTDYLGYISLEERMGCGIGACYACTVPLVEDISGKKYAKVCSDGPVFSLREVILK